MTPQELEARLTRLPSDPYRAGLSEPSRLIRDLERMADQRTRPLTLNQLIVDVQLMSTVDAGLPPVIHGVRRERLVRWDGWSATWEGVERRSGERFMLRTLHGPKQHDPVLKRALLREGALLKTFYPSLIIRDLSSAALLLHLDGPALCDSFDRQQTAPTIGELVLNTTAFLQALQHSELLGLPLPVLVEGEHRDRRSHHALACLSLSTQGAVPSQCREFARILLRERGDSPLHTLLRGWNTLPPRGVHDASRQLTVAMIDQLVIVRRSLAVRSRQLYQGDRRARFLKTLKALRAALPPPKGRAAIGVSLEGGTLSVESDGTTVEWGAHRGERQICWPIDSRDSTRNARKVLRAIGSAPPSERLNQEIQGDVLFAETFGRWLSASMRLRTLIQVSALR